MVVRVSRMVAQMWSCFFWFFPLSLKCTGGTREQCVRVCPNQFKGTNYYYQDYSQHHGVLRNVLASFICAESLEEVSHTISLSVSEGFTWAPTGILRGHLGRFTA
jgi:hypothetical protein